MTWHESQNGGGKHLIFHPFRARQNRPRRAPDLILAALFALASPLTCPSPARLKSPRLEIDCILIALLQVNAGSGKRIETK